MTSSVLVTALLAGLLGSGHCFGMCGGIAGSIGIATKGGQSRWTPVLFNLGRLCSYTILGMFLGFFAGASGAVLEIPDWGRWLRLMTSVLIFLIALQFITNWRLLGFIETAGGSVWKKIYPLASRTAALGAVLAPVSLGMLWGFLPCGLVYTMLFTAASTGNALTGGMVMLLFGLGTLPSMLGMSLASNSLTQLFKDPFIRKFIGAGLMLLAVWNFITIFAAAEAQHSMH